jgi:hypothetical protein
MDLLTAAAVVARICISAAAVQMLLLLLRCRCESTVLRIAAMARVTTAATVVMMVAVLMLCRVLLVGPRLVAVAAALVACCSMPVVATAPAAAAAAARCAARVILVTVTTAMAAAGCVVAHAAADGRGFGSATIVAGAAAGARIMGVSSRRSHDRIEPLRCYVPALKTLAGAPSPSGCSKQAALLWAIVVMVQLMASITIILGTAVLFRPHFSQLL